MGSSPDIVYIRTPEGQRHMVDSHYGLSPESRRLLMLVNGYTPMRPLFDRLNHPEPQRAADALVALGLIEPVPPELPPVSESQWGSLGV